MMERRTFLRCMGWGLAASWALGRWSRPLKALAASTDVRIAVLADAHLQDGEERRPAARALARAVAEVRALRPAPDLILFAGDLADGGDSRALALGREILSLLPQPPLMVMGEGDAGPDAASVWRRLFGNPWFSRALPGVHVLGVHAAWGPGPGGPGFWVGYAGRRGLARESARLNPETPLVILSHAPLAHIFHPWQQWTGDAPEVVRVLAGFRRVLCLHGHVHGAGMRGQGPGVRDQGSGISYLGEGWGGNSPILTENKKQHTENALFHQSLPATAWPLPVSLQGTPAAPRPGLAPWGCGWGLVSLERGSLHFQPHLWQA